MATATARNVGGRPKGARNKPRSKLEVLLTDLLKNRDKALENIRKSIEGKEGVDKTSLDTSKWLINTIVTVNRAAVADVGQQLANLDDDEKEKSSQEDEDNKVGMRGTFSTTMTIQK